MKVIRRGDDSAERRREILLRSFSLQLEFGCCGASQFTVRKNSYLALLGKNWTFGLLPFSVFFVHLSAVWVIFNYPFVFHLCICICLSGDFLFVSFCVLGLSYCYYARIDEKKAHVLEYRSSSIDQGVKTVRNAPH